VHPGLVIAILVVSVAIALAVRAATQSVIAAVAVFVLPPEFRLRAAGT
jgi:hypothetical protein